MAAVSDDEQFLVIFRLGGQTFAIPVQDVREVVPYAWLATPPRMPSFVHGVLNLGGESISVLRLDRLLGLPEGAFGLDASILVMRGGEAGTGLLVDHVDGVLDGRKFQWMPLKGGQSLQDCVVGQLQAGGQQIALLSWQRVLLQEERQRLDGFSREIGDRLARLADDAS